MMIFSRAFAILSVFFLCLIPSRMIAFEPATYVILISVDGLRPDAITNLSSTTIPNFYRFRNEGSFTDNARTDYDYSVTLPNHVSEITGRGITGTTGHGWTGNTDPAAEDTIHTNKGEYVAGIFDVVHDDSLSTSAYVGKSKFVLFDQSYSETSGAADTTGADDGTDKIDTYIYNSNTTNNINAFVTALGISPFNFSFVHIPTLDGIGHSSGWDPLPGSLYSDGVITIDGYLGSVFDAVENPPMSGNTVIILTADHGGCSTDHGDETVLENYTIPFYVWGKDVSNGTDLYTMNQETREDPGVGRPTYLEASQPIRNSDAANLALGLMGLDAVSSSTINSLQDLSVLKKELIYAAGEGGSLDGDLSQSIDYGDDASSVTAVPDTGYHFVDWTDEVLSNPRTDLNVTQSLSVTANFAIDTFTVVYSAAQNGSISGSGSQTVDYNGSTSSVTATPSSGYHFVSWSDGSTENPRSDSAVTANASYTASFAQDSGGGGGGGGGGGSPKKKAPLIPYGLSLQDINSMSTDQRNELIFVLQTHLLSLLQQLVMLLQGSR